VTIESWISFSANDLPKWVQAVGSIIAVFLAIWLARSSRKRRVRAALLDEGRFIMFVQERVEVSLRASQVLNRDFEAIFDEHAQDPVGFPYHDSQKILWTYRDDVIQKMTAIYELPLESWPNPELYIQFQHAYYHYNRFFDEVNEHYNKRIPPDQYARYHNIETLAGIIQLIAEQREFDFDEFLNTCRSYTDWSNEQGVTSDQNLTIE
jgi:hypothetical protein